MWTAHENRKGKKKAVINLPEPPDFQPLIQQYRRCGTNLDSIFNEQIPPPTSLFLSFFTDDILNTVVLNTNLYAESKKEPPQLGVHGRISARMNLSPGLR